MMKEIKLFPGKRVKTLDQNLTLVGSVPDTNDDWFVQPCMTKFRLGTRSKPHKMSGKDIRRVLYENWDRNNLEETEPERDTTPSEFAAFFARFRAERREKNARNINSNNIVPLFPSPTGA